MLSSKLSVGIHVLTLLALRPQEQLTSEYIAGSVNTNPVVIRRILGCLREGGLVQSQGGAGGGWQLAVSPREITLLDVLLLVEPETEGIAMHRNDPNPRCLVGRNIQEVLSGIYDKALRKRNDELRRVTLAQVMGSVTALG